LRRCADQEDDAVILKPGTRLRSQVCSTEVIVVRPPTANIQLTCGGAELVFLDAQAVASGSPKSGLDSGSSLGKRYTSARDETLEVLVTKAGDGTLADGAEPLIIKEARALPSSD
jgi:hypothetical protein